MRDFSFPKSGLVIESFPDPVSKKNVEICVYRGIPYADAERFRESVVREDIPDDLPIIKGSGATRNIAKNSEANSL